jgi:hypothetical protein
MRDGIEFRFYLSNPIEGEIEIDEPVGWNESKFTLKRDPKFNAITFEYSNSLRFYRYNGEYDGGAEFILFIEDKYGIDGEINIRIDVAHHWGEFETFFEGKLNLEDLTQEELFVECNIEQTDFFTTFNQRTDLKVSFKDNISVDGFALQTYTPYTLAMHSKVLVKRTSATILDDVPIPPMPTHEFTINAGAPGNNEFASRDSFVQFDFSAPQVDELSEYWNVGGGASAEEPPEVFTAKESGKHTFNVSIKADLIVSAMHTSFYTSYLDCGNGGLIEHASAVFKFVIKDKDDVEKYSETFHNVPNFIPNCETIEITASAGTATINVVDFELAVDDKVFIYAVVTMDGNYDRLLTNSSIQYSVGYTLKKDSYFKITGKTFTEDSEAQAMRIHDVFQNLINKLTNRNDSFPRLFSQRYFRLSRRALSYLCIKRCICRFRYSKWIQCKRL